MSRVKGSTTDGSELLSIPGVSITEVLELDSVLPKLRFNLAVLMFPVVAVAQIRLSLLDYKPTVIQKMDSVNTYTRAFLSKDGPLAYVSAAVALRRSMAVYVNDSDTSNLVEDHTDLSTNLSGALTTRGGIHTALGDPQKLRAYRRGMMAQVAGIMQSTPLHTPLRLSRNVSKITPTNYLKSLPFKTDDFTLSQVTEEIRTRLNSNGDARVFTDVPSVPNGLVLMEADLNISRVAPVTPDISGMKQDEVNKLPAWRKAAYIQTRSIKEGGMS